MPPKSTQAGKFRPLKRPVKSTEPPSDANSSSSGAAAADGAADGSRARGKSPTRGGGRQSQTAGHDGSGSGRGRGGGRGGRRGGPGRGSGGGRFVIPTGAAFFTGEAAKRGDAAGSSSQGAAGGTIIVPRGGMGAAAAASSLSSSATRTSRTARSAAARAKGDDEGEEIIVGEMMDVDDYGTDKGGGKTGASSSKRTERLPRVYDDDPLEEEAFKPVFGSLDPYLYDSDSSMEVEIVGRRKTHSGQHHDDDDVGVTIPPTQLPFPIAPHQQTMYDCQEERFEEEKKMSDDGDAAAATVTNNISSKLSDPPLQSPFLNLSAVSEELKQIEANSWFLVKFPTRMPLLDTTSSSSTSKKKAVRIKSESHDDLFGDPDAVGSSNIDQSIGGGGASGILASTSAPSGPLGFDDTLKDAPAGRYGKIVVRKSGKTELIIGGGNGTPRVSSVLIV